MLRGFLENAAFARPLTYLGRREELAAKGVMLEGQCGQFELTLTSSAEHEKARIYGCSSSLHAELLLSIAFKIVISLCMHAIMATFFGLLAATSRL